ncbi:hypothetical protein FRC11_002510, partial [Ceratobasidium sp. 423]
MSEKGPIPSSMKEYPFEDSDHFSPILPIVLLPDGLIFVSTTTGDVPIIQTGDESVGSALIRH